MPTLFTGLYILIKLLISLVPIPKNTNRNIIIKNDEIKINICGSTPSRNIHIF